ncbi:hypothetical protein CTZ27_32590 [Streptomyces griseocarneus]|nr:hypothetical protein CTZ27_32590 [Streptomyces griseocarneus]
MRVVLPQTHLHGDAPARTHEARTRKPAILYELCVLVSWRDALRRREIWAPRANRWRNPEDDLPPDFEGNGGSPGGGG